MKSWYTAAIAYLMDPKGYRMPRQKDDWGMHFLSS